MNKEPHTMQVADAVTASRAPENTPAMVKKIGKTTYKVHAVSYTHLPAGNIQRWRYLDYWIDGWIIGTDSGSVFSWRYTDRVGSSDAVSYTHLDVYKRQPYQ